jgi:putative ABC transport system permease protein
MRSLTALTAIMVAATIATALLNLYADAHAKLAREFRGFGANVAISGSDVEITKLSLQSGETATRLAYAAALDDDDHPVIVVGTDIDALRALTPYWKIKTEISAGTAILGGKAEDSIKWRTLRIGHRKLAVDPFLSVITGDADESRIFLPLSELQAIAPDIKPSVALVAVPGDSDHVRARIAELRAAAPQYRIEPIRNIVDTQLSVLTKMHAVMWLSTLLIATIAALSLWASLSAAVLERCRDIAILKALGASSLNVTYMFLLEQIAVGLVGALLGYIFGCIISALIGYINFHSIVVPRIAVLPWIILGATLIVIVGALIPLQRLQKIAPAAILKGE